MNGENGNPQVPEEATPKTRDTSFVKKAGKRVWEAIRSLPGEFLNFWKSYPPKARKIAKIVIVVTLIAVAVGIFFLPDYKNASFYTKGNELYLCTPEGYTRRITDNLIAKYEQGQSEASSLYWFSGGLHQYVHLTEDGRRLFYIDHITVDVDTSTLGDGVHIEKYDLYWIDLAKVFSSPVKIAEDVSGVFYVNSDGDLVTYRKGGKTKEWYQYNMVTSSLVHTMYLNQDLFEVSEDGGTLLLWNKSVGELYRKTGREDLKKIDENVDLVLEYTQDFSVITYRKDGKMYIKNGDEAPKLIEGADDGSGSPLENGTVFWRSQEVKTYKGIDFVVDDWEGKSFNGYTHQQILEKLSVKDVPNRLYTLQYFDGKESHILSETALITYWYSEKTDCCFYMDCGTSELPQLSLKDLIAYCMETGTQGTTPDKWIHIETRDPWKQMGRLCIYAGGEIKKTSLKDVAAVHINDSGTTAYIWADCPDIYDGPGKLYRVRISKDGIGEPEFLMEVEGGIYNGKFYADDMYIHTDLGDLYINGEKVDSRVISEEDDRRVSKVAKSKKYCEETGILYYLKKVDDAKTLMKYDGKESKIVQDDVDRFLITSTGDVLLLRGAELWRWNGKNLVKVDRAGSLVA